MSETIKVGMADLNVCKSPDELTTLGLGSCVGIALYDPITTVSGLAHIMLPDSTKIKNNNSLAKCADTGIPETIRLMIDLGANRRRITAKIAGGAQMFSFGNKVDDIMSVGLRNVEAVKYILNQLDIPILAEDTGMNFGRTVIFDSKNGKLTIKSVGKELKII